MRLIEEIATGSDVFCIGRLAKEDRVSEEYYVFRCRSWSLG